MSPLRFGRPAFIWHLIGLAILLVLTGGGGWLATTPDRPGFLPDVHNYVGRQTPLYTGRFASPQSQQDTDIVIVSYNLRYAEAIDAAGSAFTETAPLNEADIILLQEMDESGTADLARRLGTNYVYYPASIAPDGDNFGNAILSRWPLQEPKKLILPGLHPLTGQQRTATRATVRMGQEDIVVYSTHLEVATAPPAMRAAQVRAILADIPEDAPLVVIGGDFNTVTGRGVDTLAANFETADMDHHTADLGPTFTRFGIKPSATDHIFSRGFELNDAGVLYEVSASDHFPVWVRLAAAATPLNSP